MSSSASSPIFSYQLSHPAHLASPHNETARPYGIRPEHLPFSKTSEKQYTPRIEAAVKMANLVSII